MVLQFQMFQTLSNVLEENLLEFIQIFSPFTRYIYYVILGLNSGPSTPYPVAQSSLATLRLVDD